MRLSTENRRQTLSGRQKRTFTPNAAMHKKCRRTGCQPGHNRVRNVADDAESSE
jgi:hypothetical protein